MFKANWFFHRTLQLTNSKQTELSTHEFDGFLHVDDLQSFPQFIVAKSSLGIEIKSATAIGNDT